MNPMHSAPMSELDAPFILPADAVARYRRDGCIKLKQVLSEAAIARFQPIFQRLVAERARNLPPLAERDTYGKAFQQIMNLWIAEESVRPFVLSRRLARIAAELMEVDGVRLYHDQALFKEPGGGATPWHADQHYWPLDTDRTITAWIPLQATPLEMGPLAFSLGSQRTDFGRELPISDQSEAEIGRRLKLSDLPILETGYDLGEVSFHSGWCFHRAGGNRTTRPREVMTIIYFADGTRLAEPVTRYHRHDRDSWLPGSVVGQPIATRLNPLIWSRTR